MTRSGPPPPPSVELSTLFFYGFPKLQMHFKHKLVLRILFWGTPSPYCLHDCGVTLMLQTLIQTYYLPSGVCRSRPLCTAPIHMFMG